MIKVVTSVLAALFGVQSEMNRQRDFQAGSPLPYILIGIGAVIAFVLSLVAVVQWVLPG